VYIYSRKNVAYKLISILIIGLISISLAFSPSAVYAQNLGAVNLPPIGTMVGMTPAFVPSFIQGVNINPQDALKFNFIINKGDNALNDEEFKKESAKLIKYFLASLAIPEDEMWVNLSPYEENKIIPESFGKTEMGRDLLAQDYMLKQLMASLMHPQDDLGTEFWNRVYTRAQDEFGTTDIPLNTFNKIWIIASDASVYEHEKGAFIVDSKLKVLLEEDYLALEMSRNNESMEKGVSTEDRPYSSSQPEKEAISGVTAQIIREILIPEIEKEVNQGEIFANLRQIYNSMVLATWYKNALKESLVGKVYVDRAKTMGIEVEDKAINKKIYDQYVESFQKGVYDFIKEEYDPASQQIIPRKYFSGGVKLKVAPKRAMVSMGMLNELQTKNEFAMIAAGFDNAEGERVDVVALAEENIKKAIADERMIAEDAKTERMMAAVTDYLREAGDEEAISLLESTEFQYYMPEEGTTLDDGLYNVYYKNGNNLVVSQTLSIDGKQVVVVPYLLIATLLAKRSDVSGIAELMVHEAKYARDVAADNMTEELSATYMEEVAAIIAKLSPDMVFTSGEENLGPLFATGLIKQPKLTGKFAAAEKGDIPVLKDLTPEERARYYSAGLRVLRQGRFADSLSSGGAGSRMNLQNKNLPPDLLKAMQEEDIPGTIVDSTKGTGEKMIPPGNKGLVPIRKHNGRWFNFISTYVENRVQFLEKLGLDKNKMPFLFGVGRAPGSYNHQMGFLKDEGYIEDINEPTEDDQIAWTTYWRHPEYQGSPGKRTVPPVEVVKKNRGLLVKAFTDPKTGVVDTVKVKEAFDRSLKMAAEAAGEVIRVPKINEDGSLGEEKVINAPRGNGLFMHNLFKTGLILELIRPTDARPEGIEYLFFRNIDNVGAKLDQDFITILGIMVENGHDAMLEFSKRPPGQKGGTLVKRLDEDGNIVTMMSVEDPSLEGTDVVSSEAEYINNAVGIFSLEGFLYKLYNTSRKELLEIDELPTIEEKLARLAIIGDRGFNHFPVIPVTRAVVDVNGDIVLGTVMETVMWDATGANVEGLNVGAIEVDSIEELRVLAREELAKVGIDEVTDDVIKAQMEADAGFREKMQEAMRWVRFSPTKTWEDYVGINETTNDFVIQGVEDVEVVSDEINAELSVDQESVWRVLSSLEGKSIEDTKEQYSTASFATSSPAVKFMLSLLSGLIRGEVDGMLNSDVTNQDVPFETQAYVAEILEAAADGRINMKLIGQFVEQVVQAAESSGSNSDEIQRYNGIVLSEITQAVVEKAMAFDDPGYGGIDFHSD